MGLRLYIWEGNEISDAFHNDGTLVVLADSPAQAREIVRKARADADKAEREWSAERDRLADAGGYGRGTQPNNYWIDQAFWGTSEGAAHTLKAPPSGTELWDGDDAALDREPDRIVETDRPSWVAFNGGGYD